MFSIYLLGILVAVLVGLLLKRTVLSGTPAPFIIELPPYRFPTLNNVGLQVWSKAKDFIERATTVVLLGTVIVWFLRSFDVRFFWVENSADSILAVLGGFIAPIFAPMGFGNWQAVTSLVTGLLAKESVVSTMAVLYNASDAGLGSALQTVFTPLAAFSFLVFVLLYPPCFAAIATMKHEIGLKWTSFAIVMEIAVAWLVSYIVYLVGGLLL